MFRPKRFMFIYFCALTVGMIWILFNFGSWCPSNESIPENDPFPSGSNISRDRMLKLREQKQLDQQKHLQKWEKKLNRLEMELRQMFPESVNKILQIMEENDVPTIYAITPTYARPVQKAELTRLSQTLLHVKNLYWIVVEDSDVKTEIVANLLAHSGLKYSHLNAPTPPEYKLAETDPSWFKPKGVVQRNLALKWLRDNLDPNIDKGVVYFMDDDNTYDLKVFEEMRHTTKVSVWPVGLAGKLRYESPICKNGKVTGWFTYWQPDRPFPIDMAGFAINLRLVLTYTAAKFKYRTKRGYQESDLLTGLVTQDELEPKANNCTKVLVWHTRTENANLKNEGLFKKKGLPGSNPLIEV